MKSSLSERSCDGFLETGVSGSASIGRGSFFFRALMLMFRAMVKSQVENWLRAGSNVDNF